MALLSIRLSWLDNSSGNKQETAQDVQINTDSPSMVIHEYDSQSKIGWMNIGSTAADAEQFDIQLQLPVTYVRFRVRARNDNGFGPWSSPTGTLFQIPQTDEPDKPVAVTNLGLAIIASPTPGEPGNPPDPQEPPVLPNPTIASLTPATATIGIGGQAGLLVTLSNVYDQIVTVGLSSSDSEKVTVPSTLVIPVNTLTGQFSATGIAEGQSTITASYNSSSDDSVITVNPPPSSSWPNQPASHAVATDWPFTALTGSGWSSPGANLQSVVTDQSDDPVSPPSALKCNFPPGHPGGSGDGSTGFIGTGHKEMYVGARIKVALPFQMHYDAQKLMYFHGNFENAHPFYSMLYNTVRNGQDTYYTSAASLPLHMVVQGDSSVDNRHIGLPFAGTGILFAQTGVSFPLGEYVLVETLLRESTTLTSRDGICRVWINGNLVMNYTTLNTQQNQDGGGNNKGFMGIICNPVFGGGTSTFKTQDDNIYYSHIRITFGD